MTYLLNLCILTAVMQIPSFNIKKLNASLVVAVLAAGLVTSQAQADYPRESQSTTQRRPSDPFHVLGFIKQLQVHSPGDFINKLMAREAPSNSIFREFLSDLAQYSNQFFLFRSTSLMPADPQDPANPRVILARPDAGLLLSVSGNPLSIPLSPLSHLISTV